MNFEHMKLSQGLPALPLIILPGLVAHALQDKAGVKPMMLLF